MLREITRRTVLGRVDADRFDRATRLFHGMASRRGVLGLLSGLGLATASRGGAAKMKKKKGKKTALRLVTGCRADGGCACHACELHAANKLFASQAAVVRAHSGCNCQVDALSLPRAVWEDLFRPPGQPATPAVDKRDPRVQQILDDADLGGD